MNNYINNAQNKRSSLVKIDKFTYKTADLDMLLNY